MRADQDTQWHMSWLIMLNHSLWKQNQRLLENSKFILVRGFMVKSTEQAYILGTKEFCQELHAKQVGEIKRLPKCGRTLLIVYG